MKRGKEWVFLGLALGLWILDSLTAANWFVSIFYLPLIACAFRWSNDHRLLFLVAGVCTLRDAFVIFTAQRGPGSTNFLLNHAIIVASAWGVVAILMRGRSRIEEGLRHSESWMQEILKSSLDCIITMDHHGRIIEFNPAAERTFGRSRESVLGQSLVDTLIPAGNRQGHTEGIVHYLKTGEGPILGKRIDITALRADGTEFPAELAVTAIRTAGAPQFTAFLRDVTERKRAEAALSDKQQLKAALQSAEALFRNLVENSLVGIHIIQDGRFAYVNPKLAQIFNYTPGEVLAMDSWLTLAAEVDRPMIAEHVRQRLSNEVPSAQYEFRGLRKDGVIVDVEVRGSRTTLGGRPAVIGSLVDITERKRAEMALRESEERFRNAFEYTNVAMGLTDLNHRFQRLNPAFVRLFGYSRNQMLELSLADIAHPDDILECRARSTGLLWGDLSYFEMEMQFRHRDGHALRGLVNVSLVRDVDGRPQSYVSQIQDITARKRAEAHLRASEERFATIFRSSPVGICITSYAEGEYIDVNDAFLSIVGHTREEVLGHTAVEMGYLADPSNREKLLQDLQATGSVKNAEHSFWSKDGGERHSLRSLERITLGGRDCILTLLNDITDRKRAETRLAQTANRLEILLTISELLASTLNLDALLEQLLGRLRQVIAGTDFAVIYMFDKQAGLLIPRAGAGVDAEEFQQIRLKAGESISGRVLELGHSILARTPDELAALTGRISPETNRTLDAALFGRKVQSKMCVPLKSPEGQTIGTLSLASANGQFTEDDMSLLEAIGAQTAIAIQNADLFAEVRVGRQRLQILSRQLMAAQEVERAHIARELHDEIGQVLTAVGFRLHTLAEVCGPEHRAHLEEDVGLVDRAIQQVRDLSLDLRPPTLDLLGLEPTLRTYVQDLCRRTGLHVQMTGHLEARLSPEMEITCYRFVQATLTNVVRHARAEGVWIELQSDDDELRIEIRDDGVGFDVAAVWQRLLQRGSFGLMGLQERVKLMNGQMTVQSVVGHGTTVCAYFPMISLSSETLSGRENSNHETDSHPAG